MIIIKKIDKCTCSQYLFYLGHTNKMFSNDLQNLAKSVENKPTFSDKSLQPRTGFNIPDAKPPVINISRPPFGTHVPPRTIRFL